MFLVCITLALSIPIVAATPTHHTTHVSIVAQHGAFTFYTDTTTNNSAEWNSSFKALQNVRLLISGNASYSIHDRLSGDVWNGTVGYGTVVESLILNSTETWLVVTLSWQANRSELIAANLSLNESLTMTEIHNFGHMGISTQISQVVTPEQPTTVILFLALKREWWTLFWTAMVIVALLVPSYMTVTRYKRGKIRER